MRRVHGVAGHVYLMEGRLPEAIEEFRAQVGIAGDDHVASAYLARSLALSGEYDEAVEILDDLKEAAGIGDGGAFNVAVVYDGLGDDTNTFAWLDRSFEDHSLRVDIMNPTFAHLRADPRFGPIRERLKRGLSAPGP